MQNRVLSTAALLFTSVSAIIGSGWLFAAYYAANLAGPAALLSWIIGCVAIIIVAFTFAELCAFVPVTGASTRIPRYTHGSLVGFIFSWVIWVSYLALTAVEVQAIIQYGSYFWHDLVFANGGLTHQGYAAAAALMLLVTVINFYSLRWLIHCNNVLTIIKIVIPITLAAIILITIFPKTHDSVTTMTFAPQGIKGILTAIASGGIVFAFNGFKLASEMAGEAKNPQRSLPIAIIGSILVSLVVYWLLQYAFLAAVGSDQILHNWSETKLTGSLSPFAMLLERQNLKSFLPLLYVGAILGPFAAALVNFSSVSRSLYAMSANGLIPDFFRHVNAKGLPGRAIIVNFIIGMALFAPFPGWNAMADFLTSLMALTYILGPVSLIVLRTKMPDVPRFFKLPFANFWCLIAFYICSLLFYWTGWQILLKFIVALVLGLVILLTYRVLHRHKTHLPLDWQMSSWLWIYFAGMGMVSYCGSFGGRNWLPFGWDFLAIAVVSIVTVIAAKYFSAPAEQLKKHIEMILEHG